MLKLSKVSKKYGRRKAVTDVTLEIPRGRIIGLVGENGSGKTTLLKILAGLLAPNCGKVTYSGKPVTRRVAEKVAYMPDADLFYPYLTVQQLIDFYATQFNDFDRVKAKEITQFLKISLDEKMRNLSKGNRGRVKIAVTLGREAEYFLLDEPFSGLDPMVREDIIKGLIQFTNIETQTVVMSTHEIKEVEPLLDEIVVLKGGHLIAREQVDEIRELYGMDATSWMMTLFNETSS